jgi:hypothetical protein
MNDRLASRQIAPQKRKKNHMAKYWTVFITASLATPLALAVVARLEDVR